MKTIHISYLLVAGLLLPVVLKGAPAPFHQQGTVDPANVAVEAVEGETTRRSTFWHAMPVLARDPDGSFYVGNKRTLTKLNPEGVPQWRLTLQRSDTQSPEPGISAEHWGHEILDTGAGLPDHNAWNINHLHESFYGAEDVVNDIDIFNIQVTDDYLLIAGRVISGNGPRVYLARFSREGQFFWRQVTSVGFSGARIGDDYLNVLVDEANDVIHVTESGENHTYESGNSYNTIAMPSSQVVQIALSDGTRGAPYTFGYNGSQSPQEKNHRIVKTLILANGMVLWHAKTSDAWVSQGTFQDFDSDSIELFDPETLTVVHTAQFPVSSGTPYETGHVQSKVSDIALDGLSRVLVLRNLSQQHAEAPVIRYNLNVIALDFQTLAFVQDWNYSPDGEDWADRMSVQYGRLTLIGNSPNSYRFNGWQLSQHELNGGTAPEFNWKRDLPFDSPYYIQDYYNRFHDWAVDDYGNVYLSAVFGENAPNFTTLIDPTFFYVKYSTLGHLQFFRALPGFSFPQDRDFSFNTSASPGNLLLAPGAPESSTHPNFHLFGLVTTPETAESMVEASTKKWNLLYLEQENNVAATPMTFEFPVSNFLGGTLEGDSILVTNNEDSFNPGRLSFFFNTTGIPYRVWTDTVLPEGVFHSDVWDQQDNISGFLNGPITAPFGDYTFVLNASNAHETISKTYTIRHQSSAPADSLRPGLSVSGPKGNKTKGAKTSVTGIAVDDVQVASVKYRVKFGKKPYSGFSNATLSPGTVLRTFSASLSTKKKGSYTAEFTVTDATGKVTVKTIKFKKI